MIRCHYCNKSKLAYFYTQVATMYFKDFHLLLLGVICLATSIEKWGLHRRIALRLVTMVGVNPGMWVLFIFLKYFLPSILYQDTPLYSMICLYVYYF